MRPASQTIGFWRQLKEKEKVAREEHRREDLLREAKALVERIELSVPQGIVVVGFRVDGSASFFFDEQPVYQFNAAQQFRRGFVDDLLYKAVGGRLVSLKRQRFDDRLELQRHELSEEEATHFLADMRQYLERLSSLLARGDYTCRGQIPRDADVLQRTAAWLGSALSRPIEIAHSPRVKA